MAQQIAQIKIEIGPPDALSAVAARKQSGKDIIQYIVDIIATGQIQGVLGQNAEIFNNTLLEPGDDIGKVIVYPVSHRKVLFHSFNVFPH